MDGSRYYTDFDKYFDEHAELKPEWRAFMEPEVLKAEDEVFMFVLGTVLL